MLTNLCTYELNKSLTYKPHKPNNSLKVYAYELNKSETHKLHKPNKPLKVYVYELNKSETHKQRKLNNPQIHHSTSLKIIRYVLQNTPHLPPLSSEIRGLKHAIWHSFQSFTFLFWSNFKKFTCILHHFAFLVWLPAHNFSGPKTHF